MQQFEPSQALFWIEKLISLAIIFQSIELFLLRKELGNDGVFSWNLIEKDFTDFAKPLQRLFSFTLKTPNFYFLIGIRIFCALCLLWGWNSYCILYLFISSLLICIRWRGTFNGGSDLMTLQILFSLSLLTIKPTLPALQEFCLFYIAVQVCTSYFIAGVIKVVRNSWRSGHALLSFLNSPTYTLEPKAPFLSSNLKFCMFLTWGMLIFECLFPFAILHPDVCIAFIGLGFLFHLGNFYFFGLNRFVWAWSSTYPALLFTSFYLRNWIQNF